VHAQQQPCQQNVTLLYVRIDGASLFPVCQRNMIPVLRLQLYRQRQVLPALAVEDRGAA
jgi:hypothetical protein